jgi:broad specificity phosphatase PhoE
VTRLIVWRHGQTPWNAADRIQGQADIDLDDVGRAQASAAAEYLARCHPDAIVSSDLRRAADTAAVLATATGLPVHYDVRLRERAHGEWEGMLGADVRAAYPEAYARWRRGEPVGMCGVEDLDALASRVAAAVTEAADRIASGGTVVVVTHGAAARYAIGALLDWPPTVASRVIGLLNCHWSELRWSSVRGWLLRSHNVGAAAARDMWVDGRVSARSELASPAVANKTDTVRQSSEAGRSRQLAD